MPGVARRRVPFSFRKEKGTKEKATLLSVTPALHAGATCAGALAGCAVELTARLCRFVRTTTASQLTKRRRDLRTHLRHPASTPSQALTQGVGHPHGPSLRSAPVWGFARIAVFGCWVAERRKGGFGCWVFDLAAGCWQSGCPDPRPCVRAEEHSFRRTRARVCLSACKARVQRDPV